MANHFHSGAAMSDCFISSCSIRSNTSSLFRSTTSISSVSSRCLCPDGFTPWATKQCVRLVVVLALPDIDIRCDHFPPIYPVSSSSSRLAASSGVSPFSITQAQISIHVFLIPYRNWRSITNRPSSVIAMTFTQSGYSST